MRLLVCGSRDFEDQLLVTQMIHSEYVKASDKSLPLTVIEGGAKGADAMAHNAAEHIQEIIRISFNLDSDGNLNTELRHEQYPADWETHGKAAGPIRNKQMLDEGKPDKVLAFINKPLVESRGTKNMVEIAEKAGLPVIIVETRNM